MTAPGAPGEPQEALLESLVARFTPDVAAELRRARAELRRRFPRGVELVYDTYNALVFGYGPSERAGQAIVSVAAYPRWVTLFLLRGAALPDPSNLLRGSGKQVRSIRLSEHAEPFADDRITALLDAAIEADVDALERAEPLVTVVRAVADKQRSRRPASGRG